MPVDTVLPAKIKTEDFAQAHRDQLIAIDSQFSYFAAPAMLEEDRKQYLDEPIAALPVAIRQPLPKIAVMLVPFLEGSPKGGVRVSYERPELPNQLPTDRIALKDSVTLFFPIKEEETSEYHYSFYNEIAALVARGWSNEARDAFLEVVRGELAAKVNGEVDEKSWDLKQVLVRRAAPQEAKAFRDYGRQAFEDTLTLYLHGICCDIDVETGPRQMPSRYVRKRLEALHALYPPPAGHAVFPEELNRNAKR